MKKIEKIKNKAVMEERKPNKKLLRKKAKITENIGKPTIKTSNVRKIPWLRNSIAESLIPAFFKSDFRSEKYGRSASANG
jgi:hypothetical protein